MEIKKILDDVQSSIMSSNKKILEEYSKIEREIEIKEQVISTKIDEYLGLQSLVEAVRADYELTVKTIKSLKEQLESERVKFEKDKESFEKILGENTGLAEDIKQKNKELVELSKLIENKATELSILKKQVATEASVVSQKKLELDTLNAELELFTKKNSSVLKDFADIKKKTEEFTEKIKEEKEFIKERMAYITDKEKELRVREESVNIVANRYIKLFGDKGIAVKL